MFVFRYFNCNTKRYARLQNFQVYNNWLKLVSETVVTNFETQNNHDQNFFKINVNNLQSLSISECLLECAT